MRVHCQKDDTNQAYCGVERSPGNFVCHMENFVLHWYPEGQCKKCFHLMQDAEWEKSRAGYEYRKNADGSLG